MKRNGGEVLPNNGNTSKMKQSRCSSVAEDEEKKAKETNTHHDNPKDDTSSAKSSRFLVVRGIRYVRPYMKEQQYSLRITNIGKTVAVVLAEAFHRRTNQLEDTISYMKREIESGRVQLERHRKSREDNGPFAKFEVLRDPDRITEKGDRFKLLQHCHERCTIYRGPLKTIYVTPDEQGSFRAVFKPAGLPVVDENGGYGTVEGLLEGEDYRIGHRLDRPVSGILLLAKGRGRTGRLIKALAPESKQTQGVLKAYVARVKGEMGTEPRELKVKLSWDNRIKKAFIDEERGRETVTRVSRMSYDTQRGESVVRVELGSGARHQIRAVLSSSLNLPILGDVAYGGEPYLHNDADDDDKVGVVDGMEQWQPREDQTNQKELLLYADDEQDSLLKMLHHERMDWCDKCRWQVAETESGGTERGTDRLADYICLLSYQYRIPSLGIDVCVPDEMMPSWCRSAIGNAALRSQLE
jgi:23S rRNA-/tRNA-specific pseudouridylate synthase